MINRLVFINKWALETSIIINNNQFLSRLGKTRRAGTTA
jgi:hypothetical protein